MNNIEALLVIAVVLGLVGYLIGYNFGYKAAKDQDTGNAYQRGYKRCLFIWHKEIMWWRASYTTKLLSSSDEKAYHGDIITIETEFLNKEK